MPSSAISRTSSRPIVKHVSRQDLRSNYSRKNSSRSLQSRIHARQNRVSPKVDHASQKTHKPPTKNEQQQKRSLFRRFCFILGEGFLLALILAAIGAIIIGLMRAFQSNTSSSNTNTAATATQSVTSITTTIFMLRWNATATTVAGITSTISTPAANRLDRPYSLALDSSNTLYIADQQNNRIQKWPMGAVTGTTVAGQLNGVSGITSADFSQPSAVILDSTGNLYVADMGNNRVQFWSNGASSGSTVAGTLGSPGSGNSDLAAPFGIARNPSSGTLYIVDQSNHRVMSYLSGASSGTVVAGGNGAGTGSTQLNLPVGLYFDSLSNSLFIANAGANNIVRWVLGASSWTLVAGSIAGSSGSTSTLLNYPIGLTLDSMGNVYVADQSNHRIQLFLAGQSNGTTIAGLSGQSGSNSTSLYRPSSVALDAQLNLYVTDTYNNRVQLFIRY